VGFMTAHAPAAKFTQVGHTIGGRILDARMVQTSDYKTKRPEYWEDKAKTYAPFDGDGTPNEPKAQLELTIETGVPDDQGETERRLFVKNKRQFAALRAALKAARAREGLLLGGVIVMTLTGKEASDGGEDANTWAMSYEPPAAGEGREFDSDTVHLVGGGTWRKGQAVQAPAAVGAGGGSAVPARYETYPAGEREPAAPDADLAARQAEAIARVQRAQGSAPILASLGVKPAAPAEEPPF
jgi:hypothetical protein